MGTGKTRFLYVSRLFNRSGYLVLQHLLENGRHVPSAVLLPECEQAHPLDDPARAESEQDRYRKECDFYGNRPLRFLESIRRLAQSRGIEVLEMRTIKGRASEERLESLHFDLIVLGGGWPELLPAGVIRLPRLGVLNTHPSLLPEFRGTDVHRWQVLHGVRKSGTTIHYVDETFDTGNLLSQAAVPILPEDCPQELAAKAAVAAGPLMEETLERIAQCNPGRVPSSTQPDRSDAHRYFSRWRWEDPDFMRLDWTQPAESLHRFVLACTQESYRYNGPFFRVRGRSYLLRTSSVTSHDGSAMPGEVVRVEGGGVVVRCGGDRNALRLTQIQRSSDEERHKQFHLEPAYLAEELVRAAEFSVGDNLNDVR